MKRIWQIGALLIVVCLSATLCACQSSQASRITVRGGHSAAEAAVEKPTQAATLRTLMEGMTLRDKVLQMFIVTPQQRAGAARENQNVGGIIYFADDLENRTQTMEMISQLQRESPIGMFVSVDEEGGSVSRLGKNPAMGVTWLPAMGTLTSEEEAYQVGLTLAQELKELGFNLDFAPVADVDSNPDNPVIGIRAFSTDAATAARRVAACVAGFQEGDVLCTLKHFPGHGDTATDSHVGMAVSGKTLEELRACELMPFQSGIAAGADLVMVGHISLPKVTGDNTPATLSYHIVTTLLREELEFRGVTITDSMSMGAITEEYTVGQAAIQAVRAGIDIVLMPKDLDEAVEAILEAVASGTLTEARINESVQRILALKLKQGII